MAYEIHKIAGVMHAVVFADGALEAKSAQVVGRNQNFDGLHSPGLVLRACQIKSHPSTVLSSSSLLECPRAPVDVQLPPWCLLGASLVPPWCSSVHPCTP